MNNPKISSFDINNLSTFHFRLVDLCDMINYDKHLFMSIVNDFDVAQQLFGTVLAWIFYMGLNFNNEITYQYIRHFILQEKHKSLTYQYHTWIITKNDNFIGILNVSTSNPNRSLVSVGAVELSIAILPKFRNQKIVSDLATNVIDIVKNMFDVTQIIIVLDPRNDTVKKILAKLNFMYLDQITEQITYGLIFSQIVLDMYIG